MVDAVLVALANERVGEFGSLLGRVDLGCDSGERVPAPVGVVGFDRLPQPLKVGADEFREHDERRDIGLKRGYGLRRSRLKGHGGMKI